MTTLNAKIRFFVLVMPLALALVSSTGTAHACILQQLHASILQEKANNYPSYLHSLLSIFDVFYKSQELQGIIDPLDYVERSLKEDEQDFAILFQSLTEARVAYCPEDSPQRQQMEQYQESIRQQLSQHRAYTRNLIYQQTRGPEKESVDNLESKNYHDDAEQRDTDIQSELGIMYTDGGIISQESTETVISNYNNIAGFSAVNARAFVHVIIKRGSEFDISIYPHRENSGSNQHLELVQHGNTLVAGQLLNGKSLCGDNNNVSIINGEIVIDGIIVPRYLEFEVHMTTPDTSKIRRINASCFSRVTFHDVDTKDMELTASTSGRIRVAGDCASLKMDASSGGEIHGRELLCNNIGAYASSSGSIEAVAIRGNTSARASSGGDIELTGTCETLSVKASSGSEVDANRMECGNGVLHASSGAKIMTRLTDTVEVSASSGGDIRVSGNAQVVAYKKSSGARIRIDQ